MNEIICRSTTFDVEAPERPFVDREDGGHLRIMSRIKVKDRTELTTLQTTEYALRRRFIICYILMPSF